MSYVEDLRIAKDAKDCMFCGSAAGRPRLQSEGRMFQIRCSFCGATGPTSETKEHAVEVWNARSPTEYFALLRSWHPEVKEL